MLKKENDGERIIDAQKERNELSFFYDTAAQKHCFEGGDITAVKIVIPI